LLLRHGSQLPSLDGNSSLNRSSGGESPAASAISLILDGSDSVALSPINTVGDGGESVEVNDASWDSFNSDRLVSHLLSLELLPSHVSKLIDSQGPGLSSHIVIDNHVVVGLECAVSCSILSSGIGLAVRNLELGELIQVLIVRDGYS